MLKSLVFIEILVVIGSIVFTMAMSRTAKREIGYLPGIVFGSMAAIGFLSPMLVITHIAIGLLPLVLGRTKLQVGMVVAIGMIAFPSLPVNLTIGSAWLFEWSIQSTMALTGFIALMVTPGRIAHAPPWTDVVMVVVIAVVVVIESRGTSISGWLRSIGKFAFIYALPVYVVTRSMRNAVERRTMLTALAGAGVILTAIVLYEARGSWPLYAPLAGHYGFEQNGIIVKWRGGMMRAYGPMMEATNMGFVLVVCFTAALAARRSFKSNNTYIWIVTLIAIGSLAPQSRGGMIGIAVAFILSSFYRRGAGGSGQIMAAGALLGGAYFGAMAIDSIGGQLNNSLTEGSGSGDYRRQLLTRGMEEFWKSPLLGDSFTNVVARMQDMVQGEGIVDFVNSYLYFALFAGAIGLFMFCLAFIVPMVKLTMMRRQLPPGSAERDVAGFCLALLGSSTVMLAFTFYGNRLAVFLLIASGIALMMEVPRRAIAAKKPIDLRLKPADDPLAA